MDGSTFPNTEDTRRSSSVGSSYSLFSLSQSSQEVANYEYLVVVDLELLPNFGEQSLSLRPVELSWLVLPNNLNFSGSDGAIDKQQLYITPGDCSIPSEDYPGMENSLSESAALLCFEKYLQKALLAKKRTFCLVVERRTVFQTLRALVLEHLGSNTASHWLRTFVTGVEFGRAYGLTRVFDSTPEMLGMMRLPNTVPFTALESCLVQSTIILRMMRDGFSFSTADLITGGHQGRVNPWEMISSEVWIYGLAWDVLPHHIASWFSNTTLSAERDVIICLTHTGRKTGFGIVKFPSPGDASSALQRTCDFLGGQRVKLVLSSKGDFEKTKARQGAIRERLLGSATSTHEPTSSLFTADTLHLSSQGMSVAPMEPIPSAPSNWSGALHTLYSTASIPSEIANTTPITPNLTMNGQTMAQVQNQQTHVSAPSTSHHGRLNREVLLEMCSRYPEGTVVSLRGLPYSASQGQILEFVSAYDVAPSSLVITSTEDGKPSGDAFIAFNSAEQAEQAVRTLNGKFIGIRYIELSLVN